MKGRFRFPCLSYSTTALWLYVDLVHVIVHGPYTNESIYMKHRTFTDIRNKNWAQLPVTSQTVIVKGAAYLRTYNRCIGTIRAVMMGCLCTVGLKSNTVILLASETWQ